MREAISFWRGDHLFHIAPAANGEGYVGLRDGQIIGRATDRPSVARLVLGATNRRARLCGKPFEDEV